MADIFQIVENNGTPKDIGDSKARANIAPTFNVNNANEVGDLVLSDTGILYRFNAAYTAGTSWNSRTSKEIVNLAEVKAPLDSPAFTGIPTAPTAAAGTNSTQIATTAYADTSSNNAIIPINSSINAIDSSLAIVSNGNTHAAITAGQYVYVKNHGTLAEGLYTANSSIAQNVVLSSSNVASVISNGGGFNKLNGIIESFQKSGWSQIETLHSETYGVLYGRINLQLSLAQIIWKGNDTATTEGSFEWSIPSKYSAPWPGPAVPLANTTTNSFMEIRTNGAIKMNFGVSTWTIGNIVYLTQ